MAPSPPASSVRVALALPVATVATYQIQVRLVEEPYLERIHGEAYRTYTERTGRVVPFVGRIRRR
jgi:protein-S-isoprenylcysteine O-methyltransferase Ste14